MQGRRCPLRNARSFLISLVDPLEDFAERLNSDAVGGIFPKVQNFGGAAEAHCVTGE
jgi:hypothetical protein